MSCKIHEAKIVLSKKKKIFWAEKDTELIHELESIRNFAKKH